MCQCERNYMSTAWPHICGGSTGSLERRFRSSCSQKYTRLGSRRLSCLTRTVARSSLGKKMSACSPAATWSAWLVNLWLHSPHKSSNPIGLPCPSLSGSVEFDAATVRVRIHRPWSGLSHLTYNRQFVASYIRHVPPEPPNNS